jgi:serine/alanine racemase
MNKNKYYSGIDWMRLIAAVLVITIHTSPLASYNTTGDFILTRVIARVAVPFYYNKFWLEAQHPAGLPFQLMPKLQ